MLFTAEAGGAANKISSGFLYSYARPRPKMMMKIVHPAYNSYESVTCKLDIFTCELEFTYMEYRSLRAHFSCDNTVTR